MGRCPFFFVGSQADKVIESTVTGLGYELIETEFVKARGLWRVFIDRAESTTGVDLIGVEDCAAVSERLLDALEEAGVDYEHLEVSSPGVDRALTKPDHYRRFAGQSVRLTFDEPFEGERRLTGHLVGIEGDHIRIRTESDGGRERKVPIAVISRARIVPTFQEP
jgi:ribosome maturation factor RimP